ncbi:MAG: hypothetical protein ACREV2_19755, partial [Burkholderiales bacterium]
VVVIHQTVGMTEEIEARHHFGKDAKQHLPIRVIGKDRLPGVPPSGDVIEGAGILNAQGTGHGERKKQVRRL